MFSKLKGALIKAINSIDIASEGNQLTDSENAATADNSGRKKGKSKNGPNLKYDYTRPGFLKLLNDDEILLSADQMIRPIIVPRYINEMPWNAGYAEAVNAGKTSLNEDQACIHKGLLKVKVSQQDMDKKIAYMMPTGLIKMMDSDATSNHCVNQSQIEESASSNGQEESASSNLDTSAACITSNQQVNSSEETEGLTNGKDNVALPLESVSTHSEEDSSSSSSSSSPSPHSSSSHLDPCDILSPSTPLPMSSLESSSSTTFSIPQTTEFSNVPEASSVEESLPYFYFAIFDGHAGPDVAVAAAKRLHKILDEKLQEIADFLVLFGVDKETKKEEKSEESKETETTKTNKLNGDTNYYTSSNKLSSLFSNQNCNRRISIDSLITGALESAFWNMDEEIANDKMYYHMQGGCTALVALFILGKLYVANAGDSRAVLCKTDEVIPMSFDFTPESERERIKYLGLMRPEFLGHDFTYLDFVRKPMRCDLGRQLLYQDALMSGWAYKTVTLDDLKLPLVYGKGKRSRLAVTIGVTRGFGDHELRSCTNGIYLKPFLSPHPQVRIVNLEEDETLTDSDVLIMGTDGLWDVTPNVKAAEIVQNSLEHFTADDTKRYKYRYISAAQDLVMHSRGRPKIGNVWQTCKNERCIDDVSAFVIPIKAYKEEYLNWKEARNLVRSQT